MFDDDNKKNKDKDSAFYDNLKDLHYKDSWLHNTVELAALGAIMTGAGAMAVRGDFNEVGPAAKKGLGIMGKGFEKTLKKSGLTGAKFGWQIFKRLGGNLAKMDPPVPTMKRLLPGTPQYDNIISTFEDDDAVKNQISKETMRRIQDEDSLNYGKHQIYGDKYYAPSDNRYQEVYQQVKHEELRKRLGHDPNESNPNKRKRKWFGSDPNDTSPMFNTKNIGRDMVGNGLAGLAFGAGISGFHALDRWSGDKNSQKNLENSFNLAGSFLPKDEKDDKSRNGNRNGDRNRNGNRNSYKNGNGNRDMRKQASLNPNAVQKLKDVGSKFPEAIMSGLGYTAVSTGVAKATGRPISASSGSGSGAGSIPPSAQNLDNGQKDDKQSPHVIIELRQQGQRGHKKKQEATLKVASFGGLAGMALRKGKDNGSSESIH